MSPHRLIVFLILMSSGCVPEEAKVPSRADTADTNDVRDTGTLLGMSEGEGESASEGEGEGEGEVDIDGWYEGTFALSVSVDDPSTVFCTLYWDSEGNFLSGADACPGCYWSLDISETFDVTDGSCGEGNDFDWYWGLYLDYPVEGYGTVDMAFFYSTYYGGWYPGGYAIWDDSTGDVAWGFSSEYEYIDAYSNTYTFYYDYYLYGNIQ